MALSGTDIAILSARFGVARFGASRFGFCPNDIEGSGEDEPGEYVWKEDKPTDTVWTLQSKFSFCRQPVGPTALYTWAEAGGLEIVFTDASSAGDVPLFSWRWEFGDMDGNFSIEQNPSFEYDDSGDYTVVLLVTDDNGKQDTYSEVVTVPPVG